MSRVEGCHDAAPGNLDEVDLLEIVRRGEEVLHPLLAERLLSGSCDVPGEPVLVLGDRGHLDRVLVDLLSHAVRFTPNGGSLSAGWTSTPAPPPG